MLVFITILAVLAAVGVIAYFAQRRFRQNLLEDNSSRNFEPEDLRPLFQPSDEDLRLAAAEEETREKVIDEEERRGEQQKKLAKLDELRQTWLTSSDRANTIELLYQASQSESGEAFMDTALSVIEEWRAGRISDLTGDDLAQLLESHLWLLPADGRTPGVTFRLKSEIADLRRVAMESK